MYFRVQTCPASVRINLVFLQSQYLFALEHIIHIRQRTHSKSPHFYLEENCDGPGVAYVVYPKMTKNMQLQIITLAVLKQYKERESSCKNVFVNISVTDGTTEFFSLLNLPCFGELDTCVSGAHALSFEKQINKT